MIVDSLIFNSLFPVWIVISGAILMLAFFIYKETQRKHRFLLLRISFQTIAILSLIAILLRPAYQTEKAVGSALLLTTNYKKELADSLLSKYKLRVITATGATSYPKSKSILSWHALIDHASDIRFVIGDGIPAFAMDENPGLNFEFIGASETEGISYLSPGHFKANQKNFITGKYHLTGKEVTLKLSGPGGLEDSIHLNRTGNLSFKLTSKPAQPGKFIYQLIKTQSDNQITEDIPVVVEQESKLKILIIQPFPTFETRYLKNYLGDKGHSVTARYQISKGTYRYEYANQEKQFIPQLTSALLRPIDLLIITPAALKALSGNEWNALEQSSREGLGILLLMDQKPDASIKRIFPFELSATPHDTAALSSLQWNERITTSAIPYRVNPSPAIEGLFHASDHKLVTGYFYNGIGRIGFQLLNQTYHLALEGKSIEYADIWSPLIENVARQKSEKFKIKIKSSFPLYPDEPVHFEVIAAEDAPEIYYDSIRIPLKEDVTIAQVWHGTIWPNESGWHQLSTQDSIKLDFYISDPGQWNSVRVANQIKENETHRSTIPLNNSIITEYQPISPLIFFALFILASGGLWLVAKL